MSQMMYGTAEDLQAINAMDNVVLKGMAKQLSGMILDGIVEGIRYDYRKDEEFFLTPEILHREALEIKAQQVEVCWEWHTDPDGAFDRAERRFWASLP